MTKIGGIITVIMNYGHLHYYEKINYSADYYKMFLKFVKENAT